MATSNVGVLYGAYSGTNTIKVRIVKDSDQTVDAVPPQYAAGPFDQYNFFFTSLQRGIVYRVLRYEVDNTDHSDVKQSFPDVFTFLASNWQIRTKAPVTWAAGDNTMPDGTLYPFDVNTFANADWIGWDVEAFTQFSFEYTPDSFSYDATTGTLTKLNEGDVFEKSTYYKLTFVEQIDEANNEQTSTGGGLFTDKLVITDSNLDSNFLYTLSKDDWGKKVIIKGSHPYLTIQLPSLLDIKELAVGYFEMERSTTVRTATFLTVTGESFNWIFGVTPNEYICPGESIEFYREITDDTTVPVTSQWRVQNADGNWRRLGVIEAEDSATTGQAINKLFLGGTPYDVRQFARFYNRIVIHRTNVAYTAWNTTNNRGYYSQANSSFIAYPKYLDGMYLSASTVSRAPSTFEFSATGDHFHNEATSDQSNASIPITSANPVLVRNGSGGGNGYYDFRGRPYTAEPDLGRTSRPWNLINGIYVAAASGDATRPNNIAQRFFVVV